MPRVQAFAVIVAFTAACTSAEKELPGSYTATIITFNPRKRTSEYREGRVTGDTTSSGESTTKGARVEVRKLEGGTNPTFEASISDLCTVSFQLELEGVVVDAPQGSRCTCRLGDMPAEGAATVFGRFQKRELLLGIGVGVAAAGSEYIGACSYSVTAKPAP
jgi:hypothetical protein